MATNIPYSIASNAKEFLAGVAAEQASYYKDKVKAAKDINTFITDVDKKLRDVYDKYVPNVHVIDVDQFTNIIANRLSLAGKNVLDANSDTGIAAKFSDPSSREYRRLRQVVAASLKRYHQKLLASQGSNTNPIQELNDLSSKLFTRTSRIDNAVSARVLGVEFSRRINAVFGNRAVLAAVDPKLQSSDTRFVFFSSSFNAIGTPIRENVYKPVEKYIRQVLGTDVVTGFQLGSLVNAGHAALISDLDNFVNSPAFAQVLYGVGSGRSSRLPASQVREAAEIFKTESKLLENSIQVDKQFLSSQGGYGILLSLGVTFTNIEDAELNQQRGRTAEAGAVRSFNIQKPVELTRSARIKLENTLLRIVFRNNPALGRSSRNVVDFIQDAFVAAVQGKRTQSEKTKTNVGSRRTVTTAKRVTPKQTQFADAQAPKVPLVPLNSITRAVVNLASLQVKLNQQLQDVISANMGSGSSRNVLNYRTGRLAASARVERLTLSRDGFITAFYSYMQNPYATFSQGGRQSSPATRDPKLLISKSIREIAAEQAVTRLRSVLA